MNKELIGYINKDDNFKVEFTPKIQLDDFFKVFSMSSNFVLFLLSVLLFFYEVYESNLAEFVNLHFNTENIIATTIVILSLCVSTNGVHYLRTYDNYKLFNKIQTRVNVYYFVLCMFFMVLTMISTYIEELIPYHYDGIYMIFLSILLGVPGCFIMIGRFIRDYSYAIKIIKTSIIEHFKTVHNVEIDKQYNLDKIIKQYLRNVYLVKLEVGSNITISFEQIIGFIITKQLEFLYTNKVKSIPKFEIDNIVTCYIK